MAEQDPETKKVPEKEWKTIHGPNGSEMVIRGSTGAYGGNGVGINTNIWQSEEDFWKNVEKQEIEEFE